MTADDYAACFNAVAGRALGELGALLGEGMLQRGEAAGINTHLRLAHFLAQTCHETGGYKWLVELGNARYFARYDGRADLGNTQPGDGYRYRGRGLIQLTGRANYKSYGDKLDLDLIDDPDLAAQPPIAVATALQFWDDHGLNALADADDIEAITRRINGGLNGLADREAYLARAKSYLGD